MIEAKSIKLEDGIEYMVIDEIDNATTTYYYLANIDDEEDFLNSCLNDIYYKTEIIDSRENLNKLDMDLYYKYIDKFGYGAVTGIDFNGESQGMVLPQSSVLNVDLARIGFGQTIAVTPSLLDPPF